MQEQQNLEELRGRLLATQQQLDHSRKAVAAIKREPRQQAAKPVIEKRPPLEAAAKPVIEKRPAPAPVAKPVVEKRPAPAPVAKPVVEKRPAPAPAAKPVIEKRPPPVPIAKPLPAKQGFSLRFASATALDRQVAAGSVSLYGMLDQQAWQLSMVAGTPAAASTSFPKWFHEMSAATVPTHYLHSLKNKADGRGASAVVWGVQLPAATRTAIASLLQGQQARGQQGGALVIQGDGQVTLEQ
jgi:outer membrane biosynthesis protein TonB